MKLLIVTAVEAEAKALEGLPNAMVIAGGIGRANAAAATTEAVLRHGPFDAVISAGIAGSLPGSELVIGDVVVSSACVYFEEGLVSPSGFATLEAMGFAIGDFPGNSVPVDERLLETLRERFQVGGIATVATCSGTDQAAEEVVRRTGAIAEAMEGAAVVHAARRLGIPAIEIRSISNNTGDRDEQVWDIRAALDALAPAVADAVKLANTNQNQ